MSDGNPYLWRSFFDGNCFAADVDIHVKNKRSASGGMEKDQTVRGNRDKQVSWLSFRAPGLDWPGHSLPGKIKIRTEMGGGSIYRIFSIEFWYRVPADLCPQRGWHHSIPAKMAPF
jgi:hypothetical protein